VAWVEFARDSRRGTDAFHTPRDVAAAFVDSILEAGFTVEVDHPFSGALVPLSRTTSIGLGQLPASVCAEADDDTKR
jgi:hypothetical protein